jgi:Ca2+-binding RTX toxin-like protein
MKYNLLIPIAALMLLSVVLIPLRAGSQNQVNTGTANTKNGVVTGTDVNDKINTGDGDDNISGEGGNDFIEAGAGDDLVAGGAGDDKIQGGPGDDYIMGNEGNDTVSDGPGNDFINLGPGNDTLVYFLDNNKGYTDYAVGGEGDDTLIIVSNDNIDDLMKNQIIKYYENQNMVGADVGHVGKLNMTLGTSDFEHVMFATGFTF